MTTSRCIGWRQREISDIGCHDSVMKGWGGLMASKWRRTLVAAITSGMLMAAAATASATSVWPGTGWKKVVPSSVGMDRRALASGVDYAATRGGAGMVVRSGRQVATWGDPTAMYDIKSATKSFGSILLGLAVRDGRLAVEQPVQPVLPELGVPPVGGAGAAWLGEIRVLDLAAHTAGFAKTGGYSDLLFRPRTAWSYSDGGANWLADLLTVSFTQDLQLVLRSRVLDPLGVPGTAVKWTQNRYREPQLRGITRRTLSSGILTNVDAMARIGLMMARGGVWKQRAILPASYVATATTTLPAIMSLKPTNAATYPNAPEHYGLSWWTNGDGVLAGVPTDAFWAWGLGDMLILAVPSLDLVVARAGTAFGAGPFGDIGSLQPFLGPIAKSVTRADTAPTVDAGPDRIAPLASPVQLQARVTDDGLPGTGLRFDWTAVDGPGTVTLSDAGRTATAATFMQPGSYTLRVSVSDGATSVSDDVSVTVEGP